MAQINIGGTLHSTALGPTEVQSNIVTNADEVLDVELNKKQDTINSELTSDVSDLKTAVGTGGSVDSRIEAAKTEILGDASTNYNTLGKIEDSIESIDSTLENAAYLGTDSGSAVITGFDPQSDTLWKKAQVLSTDQKNQVKANLGLDNDFEVVYSLYRALNQSDIVVTDTLPVTGNANTIYRVPGESSYTDWMYYNNSWVEMATYNNAIDDKPTAGSDNLVKSGGVYEEISQLDEEINGGYEYQDISPTLTDNKVYNTNPSSIFVRYPSTNLDGSKCCRITATSGEKYRIYGLGGNQYCVLYTITGPMNEGSGEATAIVKSTSDLNSRTNGVEITIPEGGALLLINFFQYNSSTDKVQKYSAISGIVDNISNLENRVDTLDDDMNGEGGVIDKINALELDITGSDEEIVTENITTTSTSWTTYNLSKNIPTGSVIYGRSIPGAAYLVDINGVMDESARLDTISLPYTTTKEYKAFTTRTAGIFSFTYRFGNYSAGLEDINTFKDKTVVCFGDSLTENSGTNGKRYSDILAQLSHANVINVGVGGARIQQRRTPVLDLSTVSDDNERWQTAFAMFDIVNVVRSACNLTDGNGNYYRTYMDNAEQYLENPTSGDAVNLSAFKTRLYAIDWSKVDVVTVFGGTNDWNNASEYLGESGSTNPSRTLGAINTIIQSILTTYPHITLYWFTPIVRWIDYSGGTGIASNFSDNLTRSDMTLKQYSAILQNEVVNNHIPCCDMYNTLGWNMYNFSTYFPNNDGTHPKKGRGFDCIAKKIFYFVLTNRTF